MIRLRYISSVAAMLVLLLATEAFAGRNDPIEGTQFEELVKAQKPDLQAILTEIFPESEGYQVTGPLHAEGGAGSEADGPRTSSTLELLGSAIRVICPEPPPVGELQSRVDGIPLISISVFSEDRPATDDMPVMVRAKYWGTTAVGSFLSDRKLLVRFVTTNQVRYNILHQWGLSAQTDSPDVFKMNEMGYFAALDSGQIAPEEPDGLYPPPPDYVIQGYDNYMNYLHSHAAIHTDFADGVTAFVASDSLMAALKANAPRKAWPNKEWPMLQAEYKKFFERGGDVRIMQTLTNQGFDTLQAGEYFFAVGLSGKIRFGRELLRAEVNRIEEETGRKVPRANHAFLFPGEPVLTAGAFFVARDDDGPRIVKVNAQSGHYFYSNVSPTIREDIAVHSNEYLLTLGHFFSSLDAIDVPYNGVLISKL